MSSPWIDVAIAVAFVFFVFSLLVSGLNELVNWVGQVRSKQLWMALHELSTPGIGTSQLDEHQRELATRVIRFLHGLRDTFFLLPTGRIDHRPAVKAAGELIGPDAVLDALRSTAAMRTLETAIGGKTSIRHVPPTVFANALAELSMRGDGGELRRLLDGLDPASPLRRHIDDIGTTVESSIVAFKSEMSSWFDDQMNELSRRYRKDVRRVMFALGLLVAVATNLSAINVVSSAQRDSDLRQALVASAGAAVADNGASCATSTSQAAGGSAKLQCLRDEIGRARSLRITTFWGLDGPCRNGKPCSSWGRRALDVVPAAWSKLVHHPLATGGRLIGWLLAGIALSFGATFWFDALKRLVGYRKPSGGAA